jgi:hypothetical protein
MIFNSSHLIAVLTVSLGMTGSAQVTYESKYETVLRKAFDADPGASRLECEVTPIRPVLDFSLRFQTGFAIDLPSDQFDRPHSFGVVVLRVTPEHGQPAYLMSRVSLPDTAKTKLDGHVRGGFVVAEGKYNVEMIFGDDRHRVCRSQWRIEAKSDASQRRLGLAVLPSTVVGPSATHVAPLSENQPNLGRLTILMHVAPPSPNLAKLPANDAFKLLGSLTALLEQLHAQSTRLVVFNLEQQKVLLRKDGLTTAGLQDVAKVIDAAEFGSVDYSTLRNRKGKIDLLTQLTEEERGELHASDALVFLGLHMQVHGSIGSGAVKRLPNGPRMFYLKCESPLSILAATRDSGVGITAASPTIASHTVDDTDTDISTLDHPDDFDPGDRSPDPDGQVKVDSLSPMDQRDIIEQLVKRLKGEIIPIRQPSDCARAIHRIAAHAKRQSSAQTKNIGEQTIGPVD